MFETLRFGHDQALYLLLLLPLMWLARRRYLGYVKESRRLLNAGSDAGSPPGSLWRVRAAAVLFSTAALLLIIALARPQTFRTERQEIRRQLDVVFLLDTSPSMGAEDVAPSRLERAIRVIREITVGEPLIERVGLVTFTSSSLILSYLTSDVENVLFYLDYLREQEFTGVGTNVGAALTSGLRVVEAARQGPDGARNHPIVILLSDGEDHEEAVETALQQVARAGLTVYTVGIASHAGGFIPTRDETGAVKYLEDQHGSPLLTRLDESTLRRVAETTGGRFYRAAEGEQVRLAMREILSREAHVVGIRERKEWIDLYRSIVAATGLVALLGWMMGRD
jgi:Ca-activated chloride channel homolog